jgi:two-component system, sensor histidine kinase and response regulator
LAQEIAENPEYRTAVVLMLTSAGIRGDAARCRDLGIAAYLTKPIKQSDLYDAIILALGNARANAPGEKSIRTLITRHSVRENQRALTPS